ncbi:hypothetical protein DFH06DRAFT_1293979 [Mycena polygramma]|nr:hypothetical protein DFH06DRAFT_1293979 [Mycena polygramma]
MDGALLPAFSADLERLIFEDTALLWPRAIPRLMLVAWRVKLWVEPLLYRTILVIDSPSDRVHCNEGGTHPRAMESSVLLSLLQTRPASFFRDSVRHLYLSHCALDLEQEADLLSACCNVENLFLAAQTLGTVQPLEIQSKRLHCTLGTMFGTGPIDFTYRMFTSLTHLEIFDVPVGIDEGVWLALARLPRLTHLAFNDEEYLPMCVTLLRAWPSLQVLVIILRYGEAERGWDLFDQCGVMELVQDPRVVVLVCDDFLQDWIRGAHAGTDYWSRAEDFVAKRKSREVYPLRYFMVDSDDSDEEDEDEDDSEE